MALQPQFIAKYRQDSLDLKSACYNTPQLLMTPGPHGSRIHAISLTNVCDSDVEVQFGWAQKITSGRMNLVPGNPASTQPWTLTRQDQGSFTTDGWFVGAFITIAQEATHPANRGDFKIVRVTNTTLSLSPSSTSVQELGVSLTLWRWHAWWSLLVPRRSGYDKNPSTSGLDTKQMPWLDSSADRWLVITRPLWICLPQNTERQQGPLSIEVMGGDY